jgi:hypothetical protein
MPFPIPFVAPVTRQTLPFKFGDIFLNLENRDKTLIIKPQYYETVVHNAWVSQIFNLL